MDLGKYQTGLCNNREIPSATLRTALCNNWYFYYTRNRVVLACGYVDLRKGIDGLSMIIGDRYHQNPFEKGTLFLFCGRRSDRIKGLLWMGDGFLQLYKRLEAGSLSWPRTSEEAADLTEEQFRYLMMGLNPLNPKVKEVTPKSPV